VGIRSAVRALVRVRAKVEDFRDTQLGKRLGPDSQRARRSLLLEDNLPVFVAQCDDIAIVIDVDELLARTALLLPREVGELVVAIEMDLEGLASGLMALEQLVLDI